MGKGLFGQKPTGTVALVEPPVSASYAMRARVAFFAVSAGVGLLGSAVLAAAMNPVKAVALGVLAGMTAGLVVGVLVRVWPVLRVLWWWSMEITAAVLLVGGSSALARLTHLLVSVVLLLVLAGVAGGVPKVRRRLSALVWCAVVRHRLRVTFGEVIRSSNRARPACLPLVLFARPTPAGERVWLWLRPGLDLAELEGRTGKVAVTCWASEVRMVRASARFAALIRVDIARRDPLSGLVHTPLLELLRNTKGVAPVSPGMPPLGLDLDDVADPEPPATPRRGR
jgi:hypothetical protein